MTLALLILLPAANGYRRKEEALVSRISPKILRFHVLANSDSPQDQELKLQVRDLLLDEIRKGGASDSKEQVSRYILENKNELEQKAERYMADCGFPYEADIRFEQSLFPEKTYGDMTFPAGRYDAVRVLLGEGKGQNFWCVLYPSLCYLDSTCSVVPDTSKTQLKSLLSEEDFSSLVRAGRPSFTYPAAKITGDTASDAKTSKTAISTSDSSDCKEKGQESESLPRVKIRLGLSRLFTKR